MQRHRALPSWQANRRLINGIYDLTEHFPKNEMFGLTSQLRRAAVSAAANIAEGFARHGPKEMASYLGYSLGSLAEVDTLLAVADDRRYASADELTGVEGLRTEASKLTYTAYQNFRRAAERAARPARPAR